MKITKTRLKEIIKEELAMALDESSYTGGGGALRPGVYAQNKARSDVSVGGASHGGGGFNALEAIKKWEKLGLDTESARTLGNGGVSVELMHKVRYGPRPAPPAKLLTTDQNDAAAKVWDKLEPILKALPRDLEKPQE